MTFSPEVVSSLILGELQANHGVKINLTPFVVLDNNIESLFDEVNIILASHNIDIERHNMMLFYTTRRKK